MKNRKIIVSLLVLSMLLALSVGMVDAQEGVAGEEINAPEGGPPINDTFTYQGSLVVNGVPANGVYDFQAAIYDWSSEGTKIADCDSGFLENISVAKGIFGFTCSPTNYATGYSVDFLFDGQARYLEVQVAPDGGGAYTTLPRQSITPVPYAWSLRPGANITGTISGIGDSIFSAQAGLGDGKTLGGAFGQNLLFWGAGVYGHSENELAAAMWAYDGNTDGISWGVYASSASNEGYAVYAENSSATGTTYGVYGSASSVSGYGGYFVNNNNTIDSDPTALYAERGGNQYGIGIEGHNTSASGSGIYGSSEGGFGIYGNTDLATRNYGLYTSDNLYSLNYHLLGATMQVVQNSGSQPLQPGDVVVFAGINLDGNDPVIQVALADTANSTAVAGVVYSRYNADALLGVEPSLAGRLPTTMDGAAQPGEYLLVVVQGPAQVNASALAGNIQVGDLLSSAAQPGLAGAAARVTIDGVTFTPDGTIFAKALEALDSGEALIYVYVTLE